MCSRYGLHSPLARLQEIFAFEEAVRLVPRWNIAPSTLVLAVRRRDDGTREPVVARWGLAPHGHGPKVINARAETAAEKPLFRTAMRERRVLLPADGFFEWKHEGPLKLPFWVQVDADEPFAMGALFLPAQGQGEPGALVILTTAATEALEAIHDRMPLVVPRESHARWLDPHTPLAALAPLLRPFDARRTTTLRVDTRVNRVAADGPDLLEPPAQTALF